VLLNLGIILLIIILIIVILQVLYAVFRNSNHRAYRDALQKGDIDESILRGRSYYLSLSEKKRKNNGITNVVEIEARVKAEMDAAKLYNKGKPQPQDNN
jgi:hypothetical protein